MKATCSAEGCERHAVIKGFCRKHLYRFKKYGDPLMGQPTPGTLPKWVEAHKDYPGDDCLIWPFHRTPDGYASWNVNKRGTKVHAFMCQHKNGPKPSPRHHAAHECGNGRRGCVNPNHLSWKTPKENEGDKKRHGTVARGENHGMAILTEERAKAIRCAPGKQRDIAAQYGVAQGTVWNIKNGRTWSHIDGK